MGATGYSIKGLAGGSEDPEKTYNVVPADGTIDVERVESDNEVDFKIKTTYDGYEVISGGSPYRGGYYRLIHIKFNQTNRRYRLVCILNGGSYTPVAEDFAFYYIKFGWGTGGENSDHWYIQEYSRQGNGAFVALEQISKWEYNVLLHTPTGYAHANIGILKEDKEPDVTIEHFNPQTTTYTPTGSIITTATPNWKNGAPAAWQIIPDIQNPVIGQLGHYYAADRNLYFFDGANWHNVYSLAQGVASMLATTDAPATANNGTIYYDTTEQNLKIWYNGGWVAIQTTVNIPVRDNVVSPKNGDICIGSSSTYGSILFVYVNGTWRKVTGIAQDVNYTSSLPISPAYSGLIYFDALSKKLYVGYSGIWYDTQGNIKGEGPKTIAQVVTFTDYTGETITANDTSKIVVTASFGSTSILDFSNIGKEEGKVIEISNLNSNTITMKDGATTLHLTNSNESVIKAICLSNVWHYYKVGTITEFT